MQEVGSKMKGSLTQGSVFRNIVCFCLPFLLSYFLQTLYGLADLFIVGQYYGADVISAVAIGSQFMHMLTVMIVGLAMGSTVMIGRAVGERNQKKIAGHIGNTVFLFGVTAVILSLICIAGLDFFIDILSTPVESVLMTRQYLLVCFSGLIFITGYNVISAILRGMGDSKSPMYFVIVSCLCNIGLDYLFVGGFHMRAAGAALGTVISQTVSFIFALLYVNKKSLGVKLERQDYLPQKRLLHDLLSVGAPVALQDGGIQVSFLLITVIANRRGVDVAAAVGIVEKIISFLFLVPSSMLSTVSAIAAQNLGAGNRVRAKQTLWYGIVICVVFGTLCAVAGQFAAVPVMGLFTAETAVISLGAQYFRSYVFDCVAAGVHFCFSGYFCACQMSMISFLHNAAAIVLVRVPGAYLASRWFPETLFPMGMAAPCGSFLSVIICVAVFVWREKVQAKHFDSQV